MKRTSYCGALRETNVNQIHTVMGWVQNKRDMGGVIFIDLRDREGILQVVFDGRNLTPEAFAAAEALKLESVIAVEGPLRIRGEETYNPKLVTGTIELAAKELEVLSEAAALPFSMSEAGNVREELRLQYRFVDWRRPKLLTNLKFRPRRTAPSSAGPAVRPASRACDAAAPGRPLFPVPQSHRRGRYGAGRQRERPREFYPERH